MRRKLKIRSLKSYKLWQVYYKDMFGETQPLEEFSTRKKTQDWIKDNEPVP